MTPNAQVEGVSVATLNLCRALAEIPRDVYDEIQHEIRADIRDDPDAVFGPQEVLRRWRQRQRVLSNLDSATREIEQRGHELQLSQWSKIAVANCGFRGDNLALALVAADLLEQHHPMTLRGLMYQLVSAGWLPSTAKECYSRIGRVMTSLRKGGAVPYHWLVDGVRSTIKPSSWTGINDFAETVRDAYRLDFWASLPSCVHVICEKDAIAGTLSPVTDEYDVALSPIRGYCSLSFVHEIASSWNATAKPIFCYYLGDFDPSGFDLERDIREKLQQHTADSHPDWHVLRRDDELPELSTDSVVWIRLGVNHDDFDDFDLLPLEVKSKDCRAKKFKEVHGHDCAELDALPATELRHRLRTAIEMHIPQAEWERLKELEEIERSSFNSVISKFGGAQ